MTEPIENTMLTEDKHSGSLSAFFAWLFVILVLYFLSSGPVVMMYEKGVITGDSKLLQLYDPLDWFYEETPLHKPIGMYFHLWAPKHIDENGETTLRTKAFKISR